MSATKTTRADVNDPVAGAAALYLDYSETVDEGRFADYAALWCKDGTIEPSAGTSEELTRDKIEAWLRLGMEPFVSSMHLISHIRVLEASKDGVPITAYVYAMHQRADGSFFDVWGRYHSIMRFEDGLWRIYRHAFQIAGERPLGGVMLSGMPWMRKDRAT